MDASLGTALIASPGACSDPFSLTPELIRSQSMAGESDDDSAHPTPSAMTPAATSCPSESWPTAKTRSDPPHRAEDEVRKIHYIDSPAQTIAPQAGLPSATISTAVAPSQASAAAAGSEPPAATALAAIPSAPAPDQAQSAAAAPVAAQSITTAPSSAASTPASTPAAAPQTFARKRGRPRKHPLPDPNNPPPPKPKRKRSADADSASLQSKATAAAAAASARSAASNTGSLLSVPDLGRLIPQGSSSDNAQDFIKNNLRLFADLFVALQKQAVTDGSGRDEPSIEPSIEASHSAPTAPLPASGTSTESHASVQTASVSSSTTLPSGAAAPRTSISAPSDGLRDEIKKKMADVTKRREAIQAEMLQMRVDASFFENAQKTVDERIIILRDRIAKHTATLQREREATRQAREASRQAKKHRKAKQKGLRDSEREERRLAQTFMQLEREIAAEEEERRRLEQAESSADEDDDGDGDGDGEARADAAPDSATAGQTHWDTLEQLRALDPAILTASPSEATSMSATATPSVSNDTPSAQDRAIGFSDEELAKVLGISTTELAGFSQTLDIPSFQPAAHDQGSAQHGSLLGIPAAHSDQPADSTDGASQDAFDVAAFLEMASSLGAVASTDAAQPSSGDAS